MVANTGPKPPDPQDGHVYVGTIAGRCVRCQGNEVQHMKRRTGGADPMTGCVLDHATINTVPLIGDGGLTWSTCPYCRVMIEPSLRDGNLHGPQYGPGRGDLTDRLKARLAGLAGWWAYNGGDHGPDPS